MVVAEERLNRCRPKPMYPRRIAFMNSSTLMLGAPLHNNRSDGLRTLGRATAELNVVMPSTPEGGRLCL